jgi:hypothetical protein
MTIMQDIQRKDHNFQSTIGFINQLNSVIQIGTQRACSSAEPWGVPLFLGEFADRRSLSTIHDRRMWCMTFRLKMGNIIFFTLTIISHH